MVDPTIIWENGELNAFVWEDGKVSISDGYDVIGLERDEVISLFEALRDYYDKVPADLAD